MKITISENIENPEIYQYSLSLIQLQVSDKIEIYVSNNDADLNLAYDEPSIYVSKELNVFYKNKRWEDLRNFFKTTSTLTKDILFEIFYFTNCIQEYDLSDTDKDLFNRFKFTKSIQFERGNIEKNIVQELISEFCAVFKLSRKIEKSRIFLSHDIDTIYGSFKQDGFHCLKKMNLKGIFDILLSEILFRPKWQNIERILKIHDEYSLKSTFFWLVSNKIGKHQIHNSDYTISKIENILENVSNSGNVNGLHKSSLELPIDAELSKSSALTAINRYHFLAFDLEHDWKNLSESKIELDCSLGFAEHIGFRNSFGRSFRPFNPETKKLFNFIETPLNMMDSTFSNYMKIEKNDINHRLTDFTEKNKADCHISLLWHNTFFTNYKYEGFLAIYITYLKYLVESKFDYILPDELKNAGNMELIGFKKD